jgi:hypothetical protein
MTIEDAIKTLEYAKTNGVKDIVFAFWTCDTFLMEEGEDWAADAEYMEARMDWSRTHEDLCFVKENGEI